MMRALVHRGPDGEGLFCDGPVALGHRRLSIIDLVGGAQPIFNENRTVAVVLNGEIYNYRELRTSLQPRHTFSTAADTEVLVHLYEDFGLGMLEQLRGMFAFVLWDASRQRLVAARDRMGKKPLLYSTGPGGLWIGSEMGALAAGGAQLGAIDTTALSEYLELLYIPAPRTIWKGVRKLPAGYRLVADAAGVEVERYWSAPVPGSRREIPRDAVEQTRALLEESTRLRLRSDVPVAVLLSGGIDSSIVAALAARAADNRLKTFSVGFGEADDELPHARSLAQRYGTEHHEIVIRDSVVDATVQAFSAFSEPFGDSSAVPCSEVFREVAKHVKVVLTGDGGDELFAGYHRYRLLSRVPHVPGAQIVGRLLDRLGAGTRSAHTLRRVAHVAGHRGAKRARALIEVSSPFERHKLLGFDAAAPLVFGDRSDVGDALAFDLNVYLPDDLLVKTDITSMAASVEARCTLLDQELVDWVVPMPLSVKQDSHRGKLLLERAAVDLVDPAVFLRKKRGFGSPVEEWIRGPLREMYVDCVLNRRARVRELLDARTVDELSSAVLRGAGNGHQAWSILALAFWLEHGAQRLRSSHAAALTDGFIG
jgi:asparagine synthase (glutamine-hydrolysing)